MLCLVHKSFAVPLVETPLHDESQSQSFPHAHAPRCSRQAHVAHPHPYASTFFQRILPARRHQTPTRLANEVTLAVCSLTASTSSDWKVEANRLVILTDI